MGNRFRDSKMFAQFSRNINCELMAIVASCHPDLVCCRSLSLSSASSVLISSLRTVSSSSSTSSISLRERSRMRLPHCRTEKDANSSGCPGPVLGLVPAVLDVGPLVPVSQPGLGHLQRALLLPVRQLELLDRRLQAGDLLDGLKSK